MSIFSEVGGWSAPGFGDNVSSKAAAVQVSVLCAGALLHLAQCASPVRQVVEDPCLGKQHMVLVRNGSVERPAIGEMRVRYRPA